MTVTQLTRDEGLSATVARRVRGLMAEGQLRQADIGKILGISQSATSDRLRGIKSFDLNELPILAAALGTSTEYLLGFTESRNPRPESQDGGVDDVVRHRGLEPRTRWFTTRTVRRPLERHLRLIPAPLDDPEVERPARTALATVHPMFPRRRGWVA